MKPQPKPAPVTAPVAAFTYPKMVTPWEVKKRSWAACRGTKR